MGDASERGEMSADIEIEVVERDEIINGVNLAYLKAKGDVQETYASMRVKKPNGGPFDIEQRVLSESEIGALKTGLGEVAKGVGIDGYFAEALSVLDHASEFQYWHGSTDQNRQVEEAVNLVIVQNIDRLESCLSTTDLEGTADLIRLVGRLIGSGDATVREVGLSFIVRNIRHVADVLGSKDERYKMKDVIRSVVLADEAGFPKHLLVNTIIDEMVDGDQEYQSSFLTDMLMSSEPEVRSQGEEISAVLLEKKYGLPGRRLVDEWRETSGDWQGKAQRNINGNIRAIEILEAHEKGVAALLLREFGIVNFGRYPERMLLRQAKEIAKVDAPYGVVIFSRQDHNGAFHQKTEVIESVSDQIDDQYALRVYECGSKRELAEALIRATGRYGRMSFMFIGGHGTESSIRLGKHNRGFEGGLYAVDIVEHVYPGGWQDKPRDVMRKAKERFFVDDPVVVLISCSTGRGDDSMAQKMSMLGARVIAPDNDSHIEGVDVKFDNGRIEFDVGYGGAKTRMFENGKEVTVI